MKCISLGLFASLLAVVFLPLTVGADVQCSSGAERIGAEPPDGYELFCARASGSSIVRHGQYLAWHHSGEKKMEGSYTFGEKDGTFSTWYPTGQIQSKESFVRGIREGGSEIWFKNGNRKIRENFRGGRRHGLREVWYQDGGTASSIQFVDGRKIGAVQFWHKNGNKRLEGFFSHSSTKDGRWVMWSPGGQKTSDGYYKGGKREGVWTFWAKDGSLKFQGEYKNGRVVRRLIGAGKVVRSEQKLDGFRSGSIGAEAPGEESELAGSRGKQAKKGKKSVKQKKKKRKNVDESEAEEDALLDEEELESTTPEKELGPLPTPRPVRTYQDLLEDYKKKKGESSIPPLQ